MRASPIADAPSASDRCFRPGAVIIACTHRERGQNEAGFGVPELTKVTPEDEVGVIVYGCKFRAT